MANHSVDMANHGYQSDVESGVETYSRAPSLSQFNLTGNQGVLNTSYISFDLLNNTNLPVVKTRYDVKSLSGSSLYGSRSGLPQAVSLNYQNENTRQPNLSFQQGQQSQKPASPPPPTDFLGKIKYQRDRIKKRLNKLIFKEDDSYAAGEYEKDPNSPPGIEEPPKKKSKDKSNEGGGDEKGGRENWSGQCDFFLSCLGYAVGLGAVWRFPYLCYKNGGGVFLIPYFIFLAFVGIPLFFLELNLGQFTSQGSILCWRMAPIFKGLGISMNIASFFFCIYYNMIIAYSLFYLFVSFKSKLDWAKCDYKWASLNCTDDFTNFLVRCDQADEYRDVNGLCYNYSGKLARTPIGWWDKVKRLEFRKPTFPSEDYFNNYVLQKSTGIDKTGTIVWQLALALFIAWVIVFLCVFKGIKSSGKIVYFTSLFPYVVLIILGIKGWTLEGAGQGIEFYIKPDLSKLLDANVWFDAAVQIFFTMSTSYGGLITLASYNKFNQNTFRDTLVITLSNSMTSIFAGFVVFPYIGYLAYITHQEVKDVVSSGSGLAFVVFPFAVTNLAGAPFWSILFFVMMLTLGLDSQFASFETIVTSILDSLPKLKKYKTLLLLFLAMIMYLLGLPYCTQAGQYWIDLMDKFSGGWAILIIGTLECICIGWVYGAKNFRKDIQMMIGDKCNCRCTYWYWSISWRFISPILLIACVIFSWIDFKPLYSGKYVFPAWANGIGWLITISVMCGFIFWAIFCLLRVLLSSKRTLISLFKPEAEWGPLRVEHKRLATHLANLEPYHDSKRVKKVNPNNISQQYNYY